jgi:hypothetical protein
MAWAKNRMITPPNPPDILATVYRQVIQLPKSPPKPHPVLADIPLLTKERDRFCVAEPG